MGQKRVGASSGPTVAEPLLYARKQRAPFASELAEFVRFPSISAEPRCAEAVKRCAMWLTRHLGVAGNAVNYLWVIS